MLRELLALNVFAFLLIFARVSAALMLLPGYSASFVSARVRLAFALVVAFVLMPILASVLPGMPGTVSGLFILLASEIVVGTFLGMIGRIMISALHTAGTVIAYVSSLASALAQDPISEQQSSTLSGFLGNMGLLMLFTSDTHHLMLMAVVDSYAMFIPGENLVLGDFADVLSRRLADSFALGVQMATPLILTGLTYYIMLGLLGRLMPTFQVFFVGLPIQILIQISVFTLSLTGIMLVFLRFAQDGFINFPGP